MKILFYSHTAKISGAEKILILLVEKLNRTRFVPYAVCSGTGPLIERFESLRVPCSSIPTLEARFTLNPFKLLRYAGSAIRNALAFRSEARSVSPDVIHANSIRAGLVATAATIATGIPVFWHLQDELGKHPISTLIRVFVRLSSRSRLVAASAATLESFRGRLLDSDAILNRSRVVHNVVDTSRFRFNPDARTAIRLEIDASEDDFLIGVIGQITPRKGQKELIRAFANCLPEISNARLVIIGEPMFNSDHEYLSEIRDIAAGPGLSEFVQFLGFRDDIPELLSGVDAVAINSKSEAFVVVGVEAMATGTPVIATDVGGIREMIEDGESGLIVAFGEQEQLEKALIRIVKDSELRAKISRNGIEVVKARLNAEVFVNSMQEFFEVDARAVLKPRLKQVRDAKSNA